MDGMHHIDSFVFGEYAFINQEIGPTSTIEHGLSYDEQLLPYPSHQLTALQLNELKVFLRGLRGLRGSKYK
jgi:hypothetical protein